MSKSKLIKAASLSLTVGLGACAVNSAPDTTAAEHPASTAAALSFECHLYDADPAFWAGQVYANSQHYSNQDQCKRALDLGFLDGVQKALGENEWRCVCEATYDNPPPPPTHVEHWGGHIRVESDGSPPEKIAAVQNLGGGIELFGTVYGGSGVQEFEFLSNDGATGYHWGPTSPIASNLIATLNAPSASDPYRKNELFAVASGDLWERAETHTGVDETWASWRDIGPLPGNDYYGDPRMILGDPAVAVRPGGGAQVFVADSNYEMQVNRRGPGGDFTGWAPFTSPPPGAMSSPAVATWNSGALAVFDIAWDNSLWVVGQQGNDGAWGGWSRLAGNAWGAPAIGKNRDGRLEAFYLDQGKQLCHVWQTAPGENGSWAGPWCHGGIFTSVPVVASNADGALDVFLRGTTGSLWHIYETFDSRGWSGYEDLGGIIVDRYSLSPIAVATNGADANSNLEVFYVGTDGHAWRVMEY
ncbi:MAG: hypothetical protein NVSMB47_13110 [Polyangiales bacterium]